MLRFRFILIAVVTCVAGTSARGVEGPTVAGPIGGTDIRSALLPPPGLYGAVIGVAAGTLDFVDGDGNTIPALSDALFTKQVGGPLLFYVPDTKIFGGSVGIGALLPVVHQCGKLFTAEQSRCESGVGDLYIEFDWSRSFGFARPSKYPGAYPILQGLTVLAGFGVVFPTGEYDASSLTRQALSPGTNIWDFAPTVAVTYTTPPILAEGTEFTAKLYWNNYLENPGTHYFTGDVLDLEFAISERIGRFQLGVTGFYATQTEDDELFGMSIPPDGRQASAFLLGPVLNYDMPGSASSVRLKAITTVTAENTVRSWNVILGFIKKF